MTHNFTSTGVSAHILARHQGTVDYEVAGTFVGTVRIETSKDGGMSWQPRVNSISAAVEASFFVEVSDSSQIWVRLRCTAYTSGTIETEITATDPSTSSGGGGGGAVAFADITGNATDNTSLSTALSNKLDAADFSAANVTGKLITGYSSGAGTVAGTDTILEALNKLNGNAAAIKSTADAALPSASFTDAAVTGKLITGYTSGAGTVAATDSILQAIQKLNGNDALKANIASPTFTGSVTLPSGAVDSSSGLTFGTSNGATFRILFGTTQISTLSGEAARFASYLPSGGQFCVLENNQQSLTLSSVAANWGAFALSRDWEMKWQMGKGTSHYGKGKVRGYSSSTAVGNVGGGEDNLITKIAAAPYATQANLLQANDERMTINAWGTTGATGNTKTIKLYFGASVIGTISTTASAGIWEFNAEVIRTGSATEKYITKKNVDGTITMESGTLAINTAAAIDVKVTGESSGSADNDVLNESLFIDYDRAGN